MKPQRYFLSQHIYACSNRHHWVFLDLVNDRYLAIEKTQSTDLQAAAQRRERTTDFETELNASLTAANLPEVLSELVAAGILTKRPSSEPHVVRPQILTAVETIPSPAYAPSLGLRLMHAAATAAALARAHRALSRESIFRTVQRLRKRKATTPDDWPPIRMKEAANLIAIFESWRGVYPHDYLCMFDSLALLEFLAHYGLQANWIFGVTADPFEAHCWLQHGDVLLNDSLENVQGFSPILSV